MCKCKIICCRNIYNRIKTSIYCRYRPYKWVCNAGLRLYRVCKVIEGYSMFQLTGSGLQYTLYVIMNKLDCLNAVKHILNLKMAFAYSTAHIHHLSGGVHVS